MAFYFYTIIRTLSKIENIYFYGFSFADIDLIYIKGIFNNINKTN